MTNSKDARVQMVANLRGLRANTGRRAKHDVKSRAAAAKHTPNTISLSHLLMVNHEGSSSVSLSLGRFDTGSLSESDLNGLGIRERKEEFTVSVAWEVRSPALLRHELSCSWNTLDIAGAECQLVGGTLYLRYVLLVKGYSIPPHWGSF